MSFSGLLDHTCKIWRRTEVVGDRREAVVTFTVPAGYFGLPCAFTRRRASLVNDGSGLQAVGQRTLFLDRVDLVWQERDIVEIYEGPSLFDGPQRLEVISMSVPRGHHVELLIDEWDGELNTAPVITSESPLPNAVLGSPYSVTLVAVGGDGTYAWSVSSGSLPPGFALDPDTGVLSGTTAFSGPYTFTAQAVSAGSPATKDFELTVETVALLGDFNNDFNDDFHVGG